MTRTQAFEEAVKFAKEHLEENSSYPDICISHGRLCVEVTLKRPRGGIWVLDWKEEFRFDREAADAE